MTGEILMIEDTKALVDNVYTKVRKDDLLASIFDDAIQNAGLFTSKKCVGRGIKMIKKTNSPSYDYN